MRFEIDIFSHGHGHGDYMDKQNCLLYRIIFVLTRDPDFSASTVHGQNVNMQKYGGLVLCTNRQSLLM